MGSIRSGRRQQVLRRRRTSSRASTSTSRTASSSSSSAPRAAASPRCLRLIAGLEDVTAGEILIDGDDVDRRGPGASAGSSMVFQSYALYPHMSVRSNIAFGAEDGRHAQRRDRQEGRERGRASST